MFERNLSVLRQRDPQAALALAPLAEQGAARVRADPGNPDLLRLHTDGQPPIPLYFSDEPRRDCDTWLASLGWDQLRHGILTCVGLGDGWHLTLLPDWLDPALDVMLVEPNAVLCAGLMHHHDFTALLDRENTQLLLEGSPGQLANVYLERVHGPKLLRQSTGLLRHPALDKYDRGFGDSFIASLGDCANAASINRNTNALKARHVLPHVFDNLPGWLASPGIVALRDAFRDVPAVVVSPGPSLEDDLPLLPSLRDQVLLIAVDTSLPALRDAGVLPDLVVSIDMTKSNARRYDDFVPPPECQLVYEPMVDPSIPARFPGQRWAGISWQPPDLVQPSGALARWIASLTVDSGRLIGLGSTSIAAFGVATDLGCNPIILVGQDFAYSGDQTHARGISGDNQGPAATERVFTLSVRGEAVQTSQTFILFKALLEQVIREAGRRVYNASQRGAHIQGALPLGLQKALEGNGVFSPGTMVRLQAAARSWAPPPARPLREACQEVLRALEGQTRLESAAEVLPETLREVVRMLLAAGQIGFDEAMNQARNARLLGQVEEAAHAQAQAQAVAGAASARGLQMLRDGLAQAVEQLDGLD